VRPRIGISVNAEDFGKGKQGIYLGADYSDAVYAAGGLALALPFHSEPEVIAEIADELDGLLLSGGVDLDPSYFGEEPRLGLGEISPVRDAMEALLVQAMMARQKPVLGICRGIQVMNAVLGGTLYQDLPTEWEGQLQHAQRAPRQHMSHVVHVTAGSRLAAIYEELTVPVNTFHHQAVRKLATGFVASAYSRDGLIEAIELPSANFAIGVQWHPENLWRIHEGHRRLFTHFVQAAKVR